MNIDRYMELLREEEASDRVVRVHAAGGNVWMLRRDCSMSDVERQIACHK
jgi:hypothetical protein